jgi:RNA polymerase sigma-70 factor (ECF subfamily)
MAETPETRASLLVRARDLRDGPAWTLFAEIYGPLIHGFARKKGLQEADAADLTQDVLASVAQAIRKLDYDPARGSFRGWLFTAVRHRLSRYLRHRPHQPPGSGDTDMLDLLEQQPAKAESALWDTEFERRLFHWAAEQVRPTVSDSTWQAFWQTTVEARPPKEVARALGIAVTAVYMAKSRVLTRLKELIAQAQGGNNHE